jgi:FkbM family methyltransferase
MELKEYKYGKLWFASTKETQRYFSTKDVYQEYINDMYKKYHRNNSIILDVGANIGIFTVSFAKLDNTCKIYSFEPINEIYNVLDKNVQENKLENIINNNYALSDKNEIVEMKWCFNNWGGSSITQDFSEEPYKIVNIETKTLDSLNLTNISFMKVDVQDHELFVIKGAKNTLMNNDMVVILELPNRNEHENKIYNDCCELMTSYGYINRIKIASKDHAFRKTPF